MDKQKREKLVKDLRRIAKKHGLKNCAFCGEYEDYFVGLMGLYPLEYGQLVLNSLNIARVYQAMREKLKERCAPETFLKELETDVSWKMRRGKNK